MASTRRQATRQLWRGARWVARSTWSAARPSTGADLRARGLLPAPRDGTPPTPAQVFQPETVPSGPWAGVDPLVAPHWPSRAAAVASVATWAGIGLYLRRALRDLHGSGQDEADR